MIYPKQILFNLTRRRHRHARSSSAAVPFQNAGCRGRRCRSAEGAGGVCSPAMEPPPPRPSVPKRRAGAGKRSASAASAGAGARRARTRPPSMNQQRNAYRRLLAAASERTLQNAAKAASEKSTAVMETLTGMIEQPPSRAAWRSFVNLHLPKGTAAAVGDDDAAPVNPLPLQQRWSDGIETTVSSIGHFSNAITLRARQQVRCGLVFAFRSRAMLDTAADCILFSVCVLLQALVLQWFDEVKRCIRALLLCVFEVFNNRSAVGKGVATSPATATSELLLSLHYVSAAVTAVSQSPSPWPPASGGDSGNVFAREEAERGVLKQLLSSALERVRWAGRALLSGAAAHLHAVTVRSSCRAPRYSGHCTTCLFD
jgi:hypothetical protein